MSQPLTFGILGTGNIARQFCEGLTGARRCRVVAVGSRARQTADAFARAHAIPAAHDSYQALLADPAVEAVYVALPNSLHHPWTLRALRAGKHVLCEKPFAVSAAQAAEMFAEAGRAGRVLTEAFMYRWHPQTRAVLREVRAGAVGQVRLIRTSFCYRAWTIAGNIRFSRELAGGALMDIGCYCIDFSRLVAGAEPERVLGVVHLHETGVDDHAAAVLEFPGGVQASFTCGITVQADNTASICGTEGYIDVPVPWKPPPGAAGYVVKGQTPPRMDGGGQAPEPQPHATEADRPLYALEADGFARAVREGAPLAMPAADTLGTMRVMDTLRRRAGL
jgi:predicted dehydrogenase